MDLRVSAGSFDIDYALDRRSTSTYFLENIAIICLPKVPGIAGYNFERRQFFLEFQRGIDAAGHLSGDGQAAGLQPIGRLPVGLKCALKLPQPTAESRTVIGETFGPCRKQRACGSDCQRHPTRDRVGLIPRW